MTIDMADLAAVMALPEDQRAAALVNLAAAPAGGTPLGAESPKAPDVPPARFPVRARVFDIQQDYDPLLAPYNFNDLSNAGFLINNLWETSFFDNVFSGPTYETLRDNYRQHGNPDGATADDHIHPCFRWNVWSSMAGTGLSVSDYYVIRPALFLASRMLEEPSVLTFFKGLLERPRKELNVSDRVKNRFGGQTLYYFDVSILSEDTPRDSEEVWKVLARLNEFISWSFSDAPMQRQLDPAFAITHMLWNKPGMFDGQ